MHFLLSALQPPKLQNVTVLDFLPVTNHSLHKGERISPGCVSLLNLALICACVCVHVGVCGKIKAVMEECLQRPEQSCLHLCDKDILCPDVPSHICLRLFTLKSMWIKCTNLLQLTQTHSHNTNIQITEWNHELSFIHFCYFCTMKRFFLVHLVPSRFELVYMTFLSAWNQHCQFSQPQNWDWLRSWSWFK